MKKLSRSPLAGIRSICTVDREANRGSHVVHFYNDDTVLADSVALFLNGALSNNDAAMVLATDVHRALFDDRLRLAGIDVEKFRANGRYVSIDAADALSQFMVDGKPDPTRFKAVIGGTTAQLAAIAPRIRAFGEMVQLLWLSGNGKAAIAVEKLVNELVDEYPLSVQCAYAIDLGKEETSDFLHICAQHTGIVHSPRYMAWVD